MVRHSRRAMDRTKCPLPADHFKLLCASLYHRFALLRASVMEFREIPFRVRPQGYFPFDARRRSSRTVCAKAGSAVK